MVGPPADLVGPPEGSTPTENLMATGNNGRATGRNGMATGRNYITTSHNGAVKSNVELVGKVSSVCSIQETSKHNQRVQRAIAMSKRNERDGCFCQESN
jgi:hypothetical protein